MIERRRIVVRGRVQGVGYRWFVYRHAHSLGLAGWVRNRDDGAVEVEAQGEPPALEALESLLRQGPRLAHVSDVTACGIPPEREASFRVAF